MYSKTVKKKWAITAAIAGTLAIIVVVSAVVFVLNRTGLNSIFAHQNTATSQTASSNASQARDAQKKSVPKAKKTGYADQDKSAKSSTTPDKSTDKSTGTIAQKLGIADNDWQLVLVNREHVTPEMNPQLTRINSRCSVDSRIADSLEQFVAAAQKIDPNVHLISCYRSVAYQKQLFDMYVSQELSTHP